MSLKSFDKFCEKMILAEPGSEKEVYDERQKQIRTQLTIEALKVYGAMSMLAVMINEMAYTWCENCFPVMVLCAALAFGWWVIRNAVKGSLFGVSGNSMKYMALTIVIETPVYAFLSMPDEGENVWWIKDGMLSTHLVIIISIVIYAICGAVVLAIYYKNKRSDKNNLSRED